MAACPAALPPVAVRVAVEKPHDEMFLSDAEDDGLLMARFTPAAIGSRPNVYSYHQQRRRDLEDAVSDVVAVCVEEKEECHSDVDSVAVKIVGDQPRRKTSADSESNSAAVLFQPSQIEEKLQNHRLLSTEPRGAQQASSEVAATASNRAPRRASIWNGMVACLSPVVGYFKKEKQPSKPKQEEWEIDFADISELDFIGSGAQGAVFAGKYLGKKVAVKKVRDLKYCDEAWNLRKLDHPNIVKMM